MFFQAEVLPKSGLENLKSILFSKFSNVINFFLMTYSLCKTKNSIAKKGGERTYNPSPLIFLLYIHFFLYKKKKKLESYPEHYPISCFFPQSLAVSILRIFPCQ